MRTRLAILVPLLLVACGDTAEPEPAQDTGPVGVRLALFPSAVELGSAAGLQNRHVYEITGPDWDTPHTVVTDEVWRSDGVSAPDGTLVPTFDEPAPYTRQTPIRLTAPITWRGEGDGPATVDVTVELSLSSQTDADLAPIALGSSTMSLRAVESWEEAGVTHVVYEEAVVESEPLPARVDLWRLGVTWTFPGGDAPTQSLHTSHSLPTSWRDPIPDAPLYREPVVWSAMWAAGEWTDYGVDDVRSEDMAHLISLSQLRGSRSLEDDGYTYGGFARPPRDEIDDRVNVFLDFRRSACGEFRGLLMALIEFHGIDAHWVWFRFAESGGDKYSFYKTRTISAVGRETKNWYDTNHIIVGVGDRVYDPTYTVSKQSWGEYEDWMFEKYCLGQVTPCRGSNGWCHQPPEDEDATCIDNPPGWQDDGALEVIIADNYK